VLRLLFITICLLNIPNLKAQTGFSVKLRQPPPNRLEAADLWALTIVNNSQKNENVYCVGTATHLEKNLLIVNAQTTVIACERGMRVLDGSDLQPIKLNSVDNTYKEAFLRTGQMPSGTYKICVSMFRATDNIQLATDCITHTIAKFNPPKLVFPTDGYKTNLESPIFTWLPPVPIVQGVEYSIIIKPMFGRQSAIDAMNSNPAWYIEERVISPSFQLPQTERELISGTSYSWKVIALSGKLTLGESEVWSFKYEKNKLPDKFIDGEIDKDKKDTGIDKNSKQDKKIPVTDAYSQEQKRKEWDKILGEKKLNGRLSYADLDNNPYQKNKLKDLLDKPALPPNICGIQPIFGWENSPNKEGKFGGGLRIYFSSDWFKYGNEELLGVIFEKDIFKESTENKLTDWSNKPVWRTGIAEGTPDSKSFGLTTVADSNIVLNEAKERKVFVMGHTPEFDSTRSLWYCDIQVELGTSNYNFLRFALARFRPNAAANNKISDIELVDIPKINNSRVVGFILKRENTALLMTGGFDKKSVLESGKKLLYLEKAIFETKLNNGTWELYKTADAGNLLNSISRDKEVALPISNAIVNLPNDILTFSAYAKKYRLLLTTRTVVEDKNFKDKEAKELLEQSGVLQKNNKIKGASLKGTYTEEIEF